MLEERLTQAINILASLGVKVHSTGRHRSAQRKMEVFNQGKLLDLTDDGQRVKLEAADRTAFETVLIASAAYRSRLTETPFTIERLQMMMKDHSRARDTQFELMLGAMFTLGGVDVTSGEPDLRIEYGEEVVGVAAKRVESLRDDKIKRRAREAERQIRGSGLRGWIAINLDTRFSNVDPTVPEKALLKEVNDLFSNVAEVIRTNTDGGDVIGIMLYGYATVWEQHTSAEAPRYRTAIFQRREPYAEDDHQFAETFFRALDDRWDRSVATIWSRDYAWRM
ncbi:hypothetical protein [Candidatus Palauibacter sp.]|uniref:hypothetical protein n=1 Tax=Candidatus Palauibacter sp. TaxID=3101350 RepID=UPI003B524156